MPQVKQQPRERIFRLSGRFTVVTSQPIASLFTFKEALFYLWFTQSHLALYINYSKLKLSNSLSNRQHKIYLYIIYIYNIRYSYAHYSGSVAYNGPIGNRRLN